ncbi:MAG: molybdate ABC transporter substrate-binding protein [Deltaproteobacteria bacterium]|nr:molybdate ABC transporter substrate-binding protein [Deltaproteobacteria bacterium]
MSHRQPKKLPVIIIIMAAVWGLAAAPGLPAAEARVAVASNFLTVAQKLAEDFARQSSHRIAVSAGSTGKLYAQIQNGAPFDVFMAADTERPALLEKQGRALAGSRFTYATGRLALWAPGTPGGEAQCRALLEEGRFRRLAIANPKTAPYGLAARDTLRSLGLWDGYGSRLVMGENISQALQYVFTGNAQLGLVAWAQLKALGERARGCRWLVPQELHAPIDQQAVVLGRPGGANPAALAFANYLKAPEAAGIIRSHGYTLP